MKKVAIIAAILLAFALISLSAESGIHGSASMYTFAKDLSADSETFTIYLEPYFTLSLGDSGVTLGTYWLSSLSNFEDLEYSVGSVGVFEQYGFKVGDMSLSIGNKNTFDITGDQSFDDGAAGYLYLKSRYGLTDNIAFVTSSTATYFDSGADYGLFSVLGLTNSLPLGSGSVMANAYQKFTVYPEIAPSATYFTAGYTLPLEGFTLQSYIQPTFAYKSNVVSPSYPLYFVASTTF